MQSGQLVTVMASRGEILKRVLVSVENSVYFVCKKEEFDSSVREGREPICIGFKREDVVGFES